MRVLVTGARGMLGQALTPRLAARHETLGCDIAEFDITDAAVTRAAIAAFAPNVVVHCAAMTQVDRCESEADLAFRVNGEGTRHVAEAAAAAGAGLIYLSTDFVFDGAKPEPYLEDDPPAPISVYGASKLAGETAARAAGGAHAIVRTSWVFGPGGPNFVETMLRLAARRRENPASPPLRVVGDQVGAPTYTLDLADALVALVGSGRTGIFHVTNSGSCSWHEYACTVLRMAGQGDTPVERISSAEWSAPARRPAQSRLANAAWARAGFAPLRSWQDALAHYLAHRPGAPA